ncbi:MAG: nucleotidyltransferase domain-containing protein [Eubacterium sp.]|nr:nucleotidyltransferase domain-containing protein [Eubacterium sp.]
MNLKELRKEKKMTQQQVADLVGICLRSYKSYENEESKKGTIKYEYIYDKLIEINKIDEEHGILELDDIKEKCAKIFEKYEVHYCYLFGSYAKGYAKGDSDVDLLISANVKGIDYYGLVEELRVSLKKKVDLLDLKQLEKNFEFTKEILQDGVKIYG